MKIYKSAPLPFQGQKRAFVRDFSEVVNGLEGVRIVVDLFGGSGILSHTVKRLRPDIKVIYNDYDRFNDRIANIATTNEILAIIRELMYGVVRDKRVPEDVKAHVLARIKEYVDAGRYVDYVTLGSSVLFSGKWVTCYGDLARHTWYNCVRLSDYMVDGYLDDLIIVSEDYRGLWSRYKDEPGVVFILDPPYLSTDVAQYECYWRLADYLDVLKVLEGSRYIYFTSGKSQVLELCEWMRGNPNIGDVFSGARMMSHDNNINYGTVYKDIMMIKL